MLIELYCPVSTSPSWQKVQSNTVREVVERGGERRWRRRRLGEVVEVSVVVPHHWAEYRNFSSPASIACRAGISLAEQKRLISSSPVCLDK